MAALAPEGTRLLQQYFALPQSLFFVDVLGLEQVPSELRSERFELQFASIGRRRCRSASRPSSSSCTAHRW